MQYYLNLFQYFENVRPYSLPIKIKIYHNLGLPWISGPGPRPSGKSGTSLYYLINVSWNLKTAAHFSSQTSITVTSPWAKGYPIPPPPPPPSKPPQAIPGIFLGWLKGFIGGGGTENHSLGWWYWSLLGEVRVMQCFFFILLVKSTILRVGNTKYGLVALL